MIMIRDYVGDSTLGMMESLVKPAQLEASPQKYEKLKAVFLLILGTLVAVRYTSLDVS